MKRATRRRLVGLSADYCWIGLHDKLDILDSDARQRAELRRLRAFVRGCSTYACACGDGDICVGCAARRVLRRKSW